jgi:DNA-binding transcriptional regulator YbjK
MLSEAMSDGGCGGARGRHVAAAAAAPMLSEAMSDGGCGGARGRHVATTGAAMLSEALTDRMLSEALADRVWRCKGEGTQQQQLQQHCSVKPCQT